MLLDANRLTACSFAVRDLALPEALDIIARAGFTGVELLGRLPHLSLDPAECDPTTVQRMAHARGLRITNLGAYVGAALADDDPAAQEAEFGRILRAIELAAGFGARTIRVKAGNEDPACIGRIAPWYRRAAEAASRAGVALGYENHGGGITGDPERCRELAAAVGMANFGVLYDPCNLMRFGGDYQRGLEIMAGHIVHVHCKDGRFVGERYEYTMFGEGAIDYPWILARLDAIGYRGMLALEYEMTDPPAATGLPRFLRSFLAQVGTP